MKELLHTIGFPGGSAGRESACNEGDLGSIPGLGRSPGEGKGYPLQYSSLENSMDYPWGCKELDTTEQLSLSMFKVKRGSREEIPLVQVKEQRLCFAGAAVKRYHTSKVRDVLPK